MGCTAVLGLQRQARLGKHKLQGAICELTHRHMLHSWEAEKMLPIQERLTCLATPTRAWTVVAIAPEVHAQAV